MSPDSEFVDLLARLRDQDQAAAAEIFRRYAHQLVKLTSRRIVRQMRRKVDPEDLVQSAFRSFFRRVPADAFEFRDWESLWSLLATITLRKCDRRVRHYLTRRRNMNREAAISGEDAEGLIETLGREPTPLEAVMFGDLVAQLLEGLDERGRTITELVLQGFSAADIAPQVGLTKRSVYRQMERIRERLAVLSSVGDPIG